MHTGLILPFGLLMQLCFNKLQSQAPLQSFSLSSLSLSIYIGLFAFPPFKSVYSTILDAILEVANTKTEISLFLAGLHFILGRLYGQKLEH